MGDLRGAAWRLGIFLAVCLLGAFVLLTVFAQFRFGQGKNYFAEFANVSGLRDGDIVRIAGVEVGKVQKISVNRDATVRVEFSADDSVVLTEGSRAVIRYDDLIGNRYPGLAGRRRGTSRRSSPATRFRLTAPNPHWIWTP